MVFITSDADFLDKLQSLRSRPNISAELLYFKGGLSPAQDLLANVHDYRHHEWLTWLEDKFNISPLHDQPLQRYWAPAGNTNGELVLLDHATGLAAPCHCCFLMSQPSLCQAACHLQIWHKPFERLDCCLVRGSNVDEPPLLGPHHFCSRLLT